jgi:hypothetical protein
MLEIQDLRRELTAQCARAAMGEPPACLVGKRLFSHSCLCPHELRLNPDDYFEDQRRLYAALAMIRRASSAASGGVVLCGTKEGIGGRC